MPSLNSLTALPIPRASCGSRLAPKISTTITRMTSSSGRPREPNILLLLELLILPFFAATLAYAQFTSAIDLVEVYATVSDQAGAPVGGLTAADFTLADE